MEYYCSSLNFRNECGHKEDKKGNYERMWRDPESVEGVLSCYDRFCDDDGNRLKTYDEIKKGLEYF